MTYTGKGCCLGVSWGICGKPIVSLIMYQDKIIHGRCDDCNKKLESSRFYKEGFTIWRKEDPVDLSTFLVSLWL